MKDLFYTIGARTYYREDGVFKEMDDGGYKFIYTSPNYQITEESEYFAVHKDYKQVAAFKTADDALDYVRVFKGDKMKTVADQFLPEGVKYLNGPRS